MLVHLIHLSFLALHLMPAVQLVHQRCYTLSQLVHLRWIAGTVCTRAGLAGIVTHFPNPPNPVPTLFPPLHLSTFGGLGGSGGTASLGMLVQD
jgi:hypothetical protein